MRTFGKMSKHLKVEIMITYVKKKRVLEFWKILKIYLVWELSVQQWRLCAPVCQCDRKDLEYICLLEQKSGWIQNEFVHDGSVKHPYTSFYPHPDGQTGGRHTQKQNSSGGGGWPILIQRLLYSKRKRDNGAFPTRLTLDQSHLTFSQGTSFFLTFSLFSSYFWVPFVLSFIFILLKAKKKTKKKQGRQRLSSQQSVNRGRGLGGGTDSSLEDRPESWDIPQCSW